MHERNIRPKRPGNESTRTDSRTAHPENPAVNRRRFLGVLGTGAAASVGLTGTGYAQTTPVVAVGNTYFDPIGLYVEPGTTVRFEIEAGTHSATAYPDRVPSDATPFDSDILSAGTFEHTFEVPGTYDYYCAPHQSTQVGRIVVGEPGGPAEESEIPHASVPESELIVDRRSIPVDDFGTADDESCWMMGSSDRSIGSTMHGSGTWLLSAVFAAAVAGSVGVAALTVGNRSDDSVDGDMAMAELRKRYDRGEIDREEFERRRQRLERESQ